MSLGCISRERTVTRTRQHWELPHPLSLRACKLPAPGTATSVLNYFCEKKKKGIWGLWHVNSSLQLRSFQSMRHSGKNELQQHRAGSGGSSMHTGSPKPSAHGLPRAICRRAPPSRPRELLLSCQAPPTDGRVQTVCILLESDPAWVSFCKALDEDKPRLFRVSCCLSAEICSSGCVSLPMTWLLLCG